MELFVTLRFGIEIKCLGLIQSIVQSMIADMVEQL